MSELLVLDRAQVEQLITIKECNDAVATVFAEAARGRANNLPAVAQMQEDGSRFMLKAGYMGTGRIFGLKAISGFPKNPERFGLPKIQATIYLWEGESGRLVAMMDGTYITAIRTGSAGAVGARVLGPRKIERIAMIGTGTQGRAQLAALLAENSAREVTAWSPDEGRRTEYAAAMSRLHHLPVTPVASVEEAVTGADVIVTATWAYDVLVKQAWVKPGAYIAAIGADGPGMQELDPAILRTGKVVVDDLQQCAQIGELNVHVRDGLYSLSAVHGTIGEVLAGLKPGRERDDEITIFDSTGVGLQDVVVAEAVYRKALAAGIGVRVAVS